MKSLNSKKDLWTELSVEELEKREEYASTYCFECFNCFDCFTFFNCFTLNTK
ncbi:MULTISPECIES: hypothetical protein [Clostridium]|uniref:hypothetical protein n=1 Tax=Clostridium TaxID=1485 RepID=UPI0012FDAE06|nr:MULTISPECIES: hypothetical protein [Clostridium]